MKLHTTICIYTLNNLIFIFDFFSFKKRGIFVKLNTSTIMTTSNFYLKNNRLMRLMGTLLYLHDDTFLKSSKEFIN